MSWIHYNTNDNKYRYALGEIKENYDSILICFGINPSEATPEKLDPTTKRIKKIALEHGYDSWIILNICAQRATNPNKMDEEQNLILHNDNLSIITNLLSNYSHCSDILFAYGDLISKKYYLKKNLCEIINIIKTTDYIGNCYCLGTTKAGHARHPLYQKKATPFVPFSLDGHTYSEFSCSEDNSCIIRLYSEKGDLISETLGIRKSK